jgi:hypothetical protein
MRVVLRAGARAPGFVVSPLPGLRVHWIAFGTTEEAAENSKADPSSA